jgi:molybdopterin-guanine dinucleotide biosynthesis protein A
MDGAILAGGKSQRMGRPKPFVELRGHSLISWVLESLRPVCREVFIVADQVEPYVILGCRVVQDCIPGRGPMGGVYTALLSAHERNVFVTGCDTPFLKAEVIRYLASHLEDFEAAVPKLPDGFHPLHAVYTKDCLPRLYQHLITGRLSLIDFLQVARIRVVSGEEIEPIDPQLISFLNINTPRDLERANARLRQSDINPAQGGLYLNG